MTWKGNVMQQLIKQAIQGDKDAFVLLIQKNSQDMYKVARSILHNEEDVADALQDTIVACFEKIHTLEKPQFFKTWLIRILINQCNDVIRKGKREHPVESYIHEIGSTEQMDYWEFLQILQELEEKYRLVIILYYVQEFRVKEIASLLEISETAVKSRLKRGREKLKAIYKL